MECSPHYAGPWRQACLVVLLLFLGVGIAQARDRESAPQPTVRIPVEPLGYRPPGRLYLLARYSTTSLDFIDSTHLLLTFRQPRLLVRHEGSDGLDQVIQALVLELPRMKVEARSAMQLGVWAFLRCRGLGAGVRGAGCGNAVARPALQDFRE